MQPSSETVLKLFEQISVIPRRSGNEAGVAAWLKQWAGKRNLATASDAAGNLVIHVPASPGCEDAPAVILQGHMDMVCQKVNGSPHDFERDPIRLLWDGDWLRADGTTLGADNGIGVALALAVAEASTAGADQNGAIKHPRLEMLFTVDEEVGMNGARGLDASLLSAKQLINLDSEGDGVFIVGSAGGVTTFVKNRFTCEALPEGYEQFRLEIDGLRGGHSGVDIDKGRASSNKALALLLAQMQDQVDIRLAELEGGTARNAIARQSAAILAFRPQDLPRLATVVSAFEADLNREYSQTDTPAVITLTNAPAPASQALSGKDTRALIDLLAAYPHGIQVMSPKIEGLVETSANLAMLALKDGKLLITTSQRSSNPNGLDELNRKIETLANAAGATVEFVDRYPGWEPNLETALFKLCAQTYRDLFAHEARIIVVHAGLECGVLGAKIPGLEMMSFGATIHDAHSPDEKLFIPSVAKQLKFLLTILERLGNK